MVVIVQGPSGKEEKAAVRHIDEFTIHRFRGLQDLKLENTGQINLLVGDNNAGKTSVLEALSLFSDPLNWRKWSALAAAREAGSASLSLNERITWLFPQIKGDSAFSETIPEIMLSASGSCLVEKIAARYEQFSEILQISSPKLGDGETVYEDRDKEVQGIRVHVSAFLHNTLPTLSDADRQVQETLTFMSGRPLPAIRKDRIATLPTQFINPSSHRLSITPSLLWSDIVNAEAKSGAIELLQFFDHNIQDVDIIISAAERPTISIKHARLKRAPLSVFGDGLRRVFALAGAIPGAKDGLLLVDEVEMSIHTRALEKSFTWLVKECVKNNVQLFVTTHSLEAVDTIIDVCSEEAFDLVAYRFKHEKERAVVTRLDKGLLTRSREDLGLEVR